MKYRETSALPRGAIYGLGLIRTKLDTTTRSSIYLSIISMNVDRMVKVSLCDFFKSIFQHTRDGYFGMQIAPNWQLGV